MEGMRKERKEEGRSEGGREVENDGGLDEGKKVEGRKGDRAWKDGGAREGEIGGGSRLIWKEARRRNCVSL